MERVLYCFWSKQGYKWGEKKESRNLEGCRIQVFLKFILYIANKNMTRLLLLRWFWVKNMVMFNNRCLENKIIKEQHYTVGEKKERRVVRKLSWSTINTSEYIFIFFIHKAYKNAGFMLMENISWEIKQPFNKHSSKAFFLFDVI